MIAKERTRRRDLCFKVTSGQDRQPLVRRIRDEIEMHVDVLMLLTTNEPSKSRVIVGNASLLVNLPGEIERSRQRRILSSVALFTPSQTASLPSPAERVSNLYPYVCFVVAPLAQQVA